MSKNSSRAIPGNAGSTNPVDLQSSDTGTDDENTTLSTDDDNAPEPGNSTTGDANPGNDSNTGDRNSQDPDVAQFVPVPPAKDQA